MRFNQFNISKTRPIMLLNDRCFNMGEHVGMYDMLILTF